MQTSWWHHRLWKFAADMDRDGALTLSDAALWPQWLFYLPGDAAIALLGPTPIGTYFHLTPAHLGSSTSAWIAGALWFVAACLAVYFYGFMLHVIDPTLRQQRRERRAVRKQRAAAERARARAARKKKRSKAPAERREPGIHTPVATHAEDRAA